MILIAGGTGTLGGAIARRLRDGGRRTRVLTRDPSRAADLARRGAEVAIGDLTDTRSLDRALTGVTHVIATANAFMTAGRTAIARVDEAGNRNLIDAALRARVRQFVYTSALLPDQYWQIDYFAAKFRTEEYLRGSGVPFTILRPTAFMETWASIVGEPILKSATTQIFGDGRTPINFVAVDDVAAIAVLTLDDPRAINAVVEIGGPENLTLLDVAAIFERIKGAPARKRHLPVAVMKLLAPIVRPFSPVIARQIQAGTLVATVPQPYDARESRARWNVPMTRLEEWARARYGGS